MPAISLLYSDDDDLYILILYDKKKTKIRKSFEMIFNVALIIYIYTSTIKSKLG